MHRRKSRGHIFQRKKLQCAKMKLSKLKGNKSPLCKDLKENQEVIFILSEYGTTGAEINRFNLIW